MNGDDMAFPVLDRTATPNDTLQLGLTKRELFAGMAMQGILAAGTGDDRHERALAAVGHADALIAALAETPSEVGSVPSGSKS